MNKTADRNTYAPNEKRARILACAMEMFHSGGFMATSTAEIARCAQVSEGSVFYHFGSKLGLARAVVGDFAAQMIAAMTGDARHVDDIDPDAVIARLFDHVAENGLMPEVASTHHPDPEFAAMVEEEHRAIEAFLVEFFGSLRNRGFLARDVNIEVAAHLMFVTVREALSMCFKADRTRTPEEVLPEVQNLVAGALGLRPRDAAVGPDDPVLGGAHDAKPNVS